MPSELPSGWNQVPLAELVTKVRNGTAAAQTNEPIGPPVSRIETIAEGTIDFSRVRYLLSSEGLSDYLLRPGDILFSHINSVAHIAKSAIYLGPRPIYHGMNLLMLRPNRQRVLAQFLHSTLQLEPTRRYFRAHCKKAINQASLNTGDVASLPVILPPLPEQKKIAAILSSVDEAIQAKSAVIEQTRRVKKGLLQDLLTRGIGHTRFKQTEIGEIPEAWEVRKLEELSVRISDGIHSTPKYSSETTQYQFINGNNLGRGRIHFGRNPKCVEREEYRRLKKNLGSQTILMSINGTIGNLAFYQGETVVLGKSAAYINLRPGVDKGFIFRVLESQRVRQYFDLEVTGTTIRNLSIRTIKGTKVPFPRKAEQHQISEVLSDLDQKVEHSRSIARVLGKVKAGLLQDLLTGKVRVTV